MSVNQSRGDKIEPPHHRRSGRSGNPGSPRNYYGGGGGGKGGGGGSNTGPPSSALYSGKSFKKVGSNAPVAHDRLAGSNPNPNGAHIQPPLRGTPDASLTGAKLKPTDASAPKSTPGLPKAPQSNAVPPSSGTTGPSTPVKGPADASKAFPLQFGSISPGVMNKMQVPARTSSAPPNLDEQKRAQALDSLKATSFQNPAVSKQHLPKKDPGPVVQPGEAHPISKEKKDVLSSPSGPVAAHTQKPSGPPMPPIPTGVSMQIPFHQSQIRLPYGGPSPPMQTQNIAANTVPLPMHFPVGNQPPQVPQQVFVPSIQHHQGIIHQSQGLTFSSQIGPQLGNMGGMGVGLGPQYQQPMGNLSFGGVRRSVKITHPDTHEELRLDKRTDGYLNGGSSGQRPQMLQSQAFPPAGHPMNYYPNSYNASALFPQPPGSNPLTSSQTTLGSQPPRFHNQASKQVTVKQPAVSSHAEKVSTLIDKSQRTGGESQPHKDSEAIAGSSLPLSEILPNTSASSLETEVPKKATVHKSGSFKEELSQPDKKDHSIATIDKVDVHPSSGSHDSVGQETSRLSTFSLEASKGVSETSNKVEGSSDVADVTASKCEDNEQGLHFNSAIEESAMGSKEPIEESVDQSQNITVLDITVTNIDGSVSASDNDDKKDDRVSKSYADQVNNRESVSVSVPETEPLTSEVEAMGPISPSSSSKVKGNTNTASKAKKKTKEFLKNADARGTSDLYNAYKPPEEKKDASSATQAVENPNPNPSVNSTKKDTGLSRGPTKVEPDDWEDAADVSAPKMETGLKMKHHSEDDNDGMTKKYSRDFLLKFSDQFTNLPEGFVIAPDITEVFVATGVNVGREPYPSPGRGGGDRPGVGSRLDRRPSNVGLDDKWSKGSGGPMGPGWDPNMGYPARGNHGVLRTPRGQPSGQYPGGILSGPMQSSGPQMQRNNSDSDRWQRASGYQKGLMPSPNTPMMHKAENKYEVGKVTDEEQAKQRQLKSILNKLTPQNFEKLFDQVKQVNIDNADTLTGVIGQIFDKALMEPTFVEMYANFCSRLAVELPGFGEDNEKITFKRLLLNKCQEEFERGEREEEEANRTEEDGEIKQSEEEREEKRVKARRRMLGNIRLIGELYKKRMLTERIMHECIKKMLGFNQNPTSNPDEENIEALCKLMSTIGEMIDHPKAKEHMDAYFDMMLKLSNNMIISSRVRFMLKDAIDLRKNKWQQRRKVEGPKKIEEVHRDAAQERLAQSSRLARGNSNLSLRRGGQPMDFGPRGSTGVLPSNPQMGGGYRGLPQQQSRGFGNQDSRFESFDNRTLSVPSRPVGDESITLGPQGGLARGMSVRGHPSSMQGFAGPNNGYSSSMVPERGGYGPRDDLASRYMPDRYSPRPSYDPPNTQEHNNMNYVNQHGFDRVRPSTPPDRTRVFTPPHSVSSDQPVMSDDLHDLSIKAIKEFYSARDQKEVAFRIKDLNAPGFYPSMISIWVNDSFERKDMDRDSLAKLLVNLTKSQEDILTQDSLVKGLESVLSTLEDAVNDAPKASEYLGRMLARILIDNVIPYQQVWRMIHEGGEEQGQLVESGLAADVLGVILETIKSEKGDPFFDDLRSSSNPRLENFRPPTLKKTSRLDKFI